MAKFQMRELIGVNTITARLGASDSEADRLNDKDAGKFVKFGGDSRYVLAAAGDAIEGKIVSVDTATTDGYSTGSVQEDGNLTVVLDGAQADGTGSIAVGEYVVAGTPVAKGVAQGDNGPKVRKATDQTAAKNSPFAWRVVALLVGNGAVGTVATIRKV